MAQHYSAPRGFVGRNLCYAIIYNGIYYGYIVAGSSVRNLPGVETYLNIKTERDFQNIVNNIFFHVFPNPIYPFRNFTPTVLKAFRKRVEHDWPINYYSHVRGYESLVELPRPGTVYLRDGWEVVGQTKGYQCKRDAGTGTDWWSGKRVWVTDDLRPKLVFARKV